MRNLTRLLLLFTIMAACTPLGGTQAPASAGIPPVQASATSSEARVEAVSPAATALPIATSRGPALQATDPSTVSMASGSLQLIEFFRFT
jgi:hypothetical protein